MKDIGAVLITGASGGIGSALARAYARPGMRLALTGRNPERLETVASACTAAGATVMHRALDITDTAAVSTWIAAADHAFVLDLAIANAGASGGHDGPGAEEGLAAFQRIMAVNLTGAAVTAYAVIPAMRRRRPRVRNRS
jgi:NADP-dependent 3-hydroxy acid dehydrogenase YdfG